MTMDIIFQGVSMSLFEAKQPSSRLSSWDFEDAVGEPAPSPFETPTSWALSSRPLPLRSLREALRSQWNLGLPSAQGEGEALESGA